MSAWESEYTETAAYLELAVIAGSGFFSAFFDPPLMARAAPPKAMANVPRAMYSFLMVWPGWAGQRGPL